ncbi:selenoprotein H [Tachysurus ichikawai]
MCLQKQSLWPNRIKGTRVNRRTMKDRESSSNTVKADVCTGGMPMHFEVTLIDGSKEVVLWTGIKKGPPRKLKFPEPAEVVTALDNALKSE